MQETDTLLDDWLVLDTASPLVFEKEVLPVGKLSKWVDGTKKLFEANITRPFLDNVVKNFQKFKQALIRVPVFKTHNEDPDNKRGQIEDVYIKPNSKGVDSLHVKTRFDSADAVQLARDNEVSVYIPTRHVDSNKTEYAYPLRHLAITSTPVLSGLDGWKGPVVLAYEPEKQGEPEVDLKPIFTALKLDHSEDASADDQLKLAVAAIKTLSEANAELEVQLAAVGEGEGEGEGEGTVELSFPPMLMKQMKRTRAAELDSLMLDSTISPAMGKELKDKYCSDEAIRLDLSLDTEDAEFDRTVALAKRFAKDRPLPNNGKRVIKLDHSKENNPVTADAQRRADKAKAAAK